jgi:hypothetical protein
LAASAPPSAPSPTATTVNGTPAAAGVPVEGVNWSGLTGGWRTPLRKVSPTLA